MCPKHPLRSRIIIRCGVGRCTRGRGRQNSGRRGASAGASAWPGAWASKEAIKKANGSRSITKLSLGEEKTIRVEEELKL